MAIIETRQLTKKYGEQLAVNQLNIQIKSGSLTAYLGTNGAGKSTTIRMLTGTLQPTSGEILYNGKLNHSSIKIGVVFQNSVLDDELTVMENLLLRAEMYHHVDQKRLDELITKIGINEYAQKKYGRLSGGMRRKVDIARALIHQPEILFLDEPTTGLDLQSRKEIWQLLNALKESENIGILLTTHYLEEAEYADSVYILENGQLLEAGTAESLKRKYSTPMVWLKVKDKTNLKLSIDQKQIVGEDDRGICINVKNIIEMFDLFEAERHNIIDFTYQPIGMNEVFLKVTGRNFNHDSNR
ncbi:MULTISPECIES: ABC transporter ATP-binding protein [unclassified Enterococcus]|uniref:ABC transporter ATP-binding protein n=1 Tax=unclassified Enterococcus TaxID=2608891 RepID=UPI0015521037|nr:MULTISPECIES: ABC transporter ATP-binding protein [unclassified Enterococcus]MBS7576909.1 ABC transporter ATP-binding protein [Enterococcus sp. MMGLQ5-2]MBS7584316.1 ABC transporter ATP-binding protein [Enterococcus sp. MMGLQ5-1]NPD12172.1 ABC transporter ATP-binding protein [Enterococcus sp. MMGLQ5-1]NPD36744.1 ABC transporter ATP-binding protein [Enterococcus sp. MMGLQ5-2]